MPDLDPETKVSIFDQYVMHDPEIQRRIEQAMHKADPTAYMPAAELRDDMGKLRDENAKLKQELEEKLGKIESDRIAQEELLKAKTEHGASEDEWKQLPKFMQENGIVDAGKGLEFMRLSQVRKAAEPDPNRGRMGFSRGMIDQISGKVDRRTARRQTLLTALEQMRQAQARSDFLSTR